MRVRCDALAVGTPIWMLEDSAYNILHTIRETLPTLHYLNLQDPSALFSSRRSSHTQSDRSGVQDPERGCCTHS
jgi:hypothetical protein